MKLGNLLRCRWASARLRSAIVLTAAVLITPSAHSQTDETGLTLQQAIARALDHHPSLRVFQLRQEKLEGLRKSADLPPAWHLEAEVENFAGTGGSQGFDVSEQTLALSSVIELGNKRAARVAVVDARTGLVDTERQVEALALAGQVTERFVGLLATRQRLQLAKEAVDLAHRALRIVTERARAGAASEAEVLRAKAAKTQAELAVAQLERELTTHRIQLSALFGSTSADFGALSGDIFQLPHADDFEQLYERAVQNPMMRAFEDEERLENAELRLARRGAAGDIKWRLGARRVAGTGDTGLVASVSLPLFSEQRSRGDVAAARADRDQVRVRREEARLRLHAQLYEAYSSRQQSVETVRALRQSIIPALTKALQLTQQAYENGRYSYVDWMAAQQELLSAKQALIDAAASALIYGAVIEQLTAEPLSTVAAAAGQG
jgi:cobalt-zinc-cadmium efflux system outer membrane protein